MLQFYHSYESRKGVNLINNKFFPVAPLLPVFAAFSASAVSKKSAAIGLQGGYNPTSQGYGASITFKLSSAPCVFAADADFTGGQLNAIGLTADWWLKNPRLAGMFHFYYGPGFAVAFYPKATGCAIGFRLVAGANIFVIPELELYLQAAWQPSFYFASDYSGFVWNNFPVNFGFRFWF